MKGLITPGNVIAVAASAPLARAAETIRVAIGTQDATIAVAA